jgi:hypothetical protein
MQQLNRVSFLLSVVLVRFECAPLLGLLGLLYLGREGLDGSSRVILLHVPASALLLVILQTH